MTKALPGLLALVLAACSLAPQLTAQEVVLSSEDYLQPPEAITRVITSDALHNRVILRNLSPDREHFLVTRTQGMPSLSVMARPYVNLGETPLDARAMRSRRLSTGVSVGYDLFSWKTEKITPITVPKGVTLSAATWSPDGTRLAFMVHEQEASFLWLADVATGDAARLTDSPLLATLVANLQWTGDGQHICAVFVPRDHQPLPEPDPVAHEPRVWISQADRTPSRTYRFLLKTPHDKALLESLSTGQLALVSVQNGDLSPIGSAAMITSFSIAPKGQQVRVTTMQKPFSYLVPRRSFGSREELWDLEGRVLAKISERKLQVGQAAGRRRGGAGNGGDGRRQLAWRPDGQGLSFLQREPAKKTPQSKAAGPKPAPDSSQVPGQKAAPGKLKVKPGAAGGVLAARTGRRPQRGARRPDRRVQRGAGPKPATREDLDANEKEKEKPKRKDRIMQWLPPFDEKSEKVVWESPDPIQSVRYSQDCKTLFISQRKQGKTHLFALRLAAPQQQLTIQKTKGPDPSGGRFRGFRRRGGGSAARLLMRPGVHGGTVVRMPQDGRSVFLSGSSQPKDRNSEAPRPFLDRVELATGKKVRLWQSAEHVFESGLLPLDDTCSTLAISRESPSMVPNSWLLDTKTRDLRQLTHNEDPAPKVTAARHLRLRVTRVDGFKFWVRVTIPVDHGERLPALFWFYPREYTSQKAYDDSQRRYNKNRFPTLGTRSMELLTLLGYALVQPDCPIVGEAGRMNNNFVGDLRNSLWAVIDALDKRNIIDRDRLAIGGHSYGAFGTANALVHTPFFKAGIAGDGNYNRTLTPMSFQSERRNIWDAREVYTRMSPLLWADQLNGALLMYHGMDDNNTGTFPINSPRMFQALNGLGKPCALYMYPYESHGPRARETILDLWSRWVEWLEIHVKHPERAKEMYKQAKPRAISEKGGAG